MSEFNKDSIFKEYAEKTLNIMYFRHYMLNKF